MKKNLFIFVADSLRYDYLPENIASKGSVMKCLAPSLHTPVSFSSLVTGLSPENHAVRGFGDVLSRSHTTIFDRFEDGTYYDNELDPVRRTVLRHTPEKKELEGLEQPFVFVERAMDSHTPYGEMGHGNDLLTHTKEPSADVRNMENLHEEYEKGVEAVEEHFWSHVEKLEELGIRDETLIIFTSDHGEMLGERINFRRRYAHAHPMCRELVEVPVVFLDTDVEAEAMRFIDIPETALSLLGKEGLEADGKDVNSQQVNEGISLIDGYSSFRNRWVFENSRWRPESRLKLKKDIFCEDLRMLLDKFTDSQILPRPGREIKESEIADVEV